MVARCKRRHPFNDGGVQMNYKNWLKKNYIDEDSAKGDFARDINRDERFPKNGVGKFDGWKKLIAEYLMKHGAVPECMAAFDETWEEYVKCEKKK